MKLDNLELIGIHIKKTGGMSFKRLLKRQYARKYYRINAGPNIKNRDEILKQKLEAIPEDTRVIHGHITYRDIVPLIEEKPGVPVITWLREPVERMISLYYYAKLKFEQGLRPEYPYMVDISLVDFLKLRYRNESYSYVLDGCNLEDLAFVGVLEHLDADLEHLGRLMGWKMLSMPRINVNTEYKAKYPKPSEQEYGEIRKMIAADLELYAHALELRRKRLR